MTGTDDKPGREEPGRPEKLLTAARREAKTRGEPPLHWYYRLFRLGAAPGFASVKGIEVGLHNERPAAVVVPAAAVPAFHAHLRGLPASGVPPKGPSSQAARRGRGKEELHPLAQKTIKAPKHIVGARVTGPVHPERLLTIGSVLEATVEPPSEIPEELSRWLELLDKAEMAVEEAGLVIGSHEEWLAAGLMAFVFDPDVWRAIRHALRGPSRLAPGRHRGTTA